nr:MAG TPA: hypothetical protein [Caudoviricetes sp.]
MKIETKFKTVIISAVFSTYLLDFERVRIPPTPP